MTSVKLPNCLENVISIIAHIRDALNRHNLREALLYTSEATAAVQNELDWCLGSDSNLASMREFLDVLFETIIKLGNANESDKPHLQAHVQDALKVLQTTIIHLTSRSTLYDAPESYEYLELVSRVGQFK